MNIIKQIQYFTQNQINDILISTITLVNKSLKQYLHTLHYTRILLETNHVLIEFYSV